MDCCGGQVDVGVGARQRLELDRCGGPEVLVARPAVPISEVELDPVAIDGDQGRALDGLVAG